MIRVESNCNSCDDVSNQFAVSLKNNILEMHFSNQLEGFVETKHFNFYRFQQPIEIACSSFYEETIGVSRRHMPMPKRFCVQIAFRVSLLWFLPFHLVLLDIA